MELRRWVLGLPLMLTAVIAVTGALAYGMFYGLLALEARRPPPVLATMPDFRFLNQRGEEFTREDLLGSIWIAAFVYTRCPDICPQIVARLKTQAQRLPEEVRFLVFTVDPTYDTPEVLAAFAESWGLDARWVFLTGEKDALYTFVRDAFRVTALEVFDRESRFITHTGQVVLLDREARLRGYYSSLDDQNLSRLAEDLRKIL